MLHFICLKCCQAVSLSKCLTKRVVCLQLYTAYLESQEQLQLERLENKRVNKYLDDIVQEVEAKAPILKRQRDEHERMQKSVTSLSAKLEQAVKVCDVNEVQVCMGLLFYVDFQYVP